MNLMKKSGIAWIGDIPNHWNVFRNKNAFTCSKNIVGTNSSSTQLLSLTTKGIKTKEITNAEGKLPESFDTYQLVKEKNIVMCLFDLDISAVFSGISPFNGMISPAYKVLSCNDRMYPAYADYWFKYIGFERKFNHYAKNIRFTLNIDEFMSLPMLFPPLAEQQIIAEYLDYECSHIDSLISKQEESIVKLKEYKLSLISEIVTKGLDANVSMKDSEVNSIGEIPSHWSIQKIKNITDKVTVGVVIRPSDYFDRNGTVPFLRGLNIKEYEVSSENMVYITDKSNKMLSKSVIHTDDILIVRDGAIGVSCVVPDKYDGSNVVSLIIIGRDARFNSHYLCYFLNSLSGRMQFAITQIGSALTHTSVGTVSDLFVTIPPIEEQQLIVLHLKKIIENTDTVIANKKNIITKLKEYKNALIYEVVTGKKEVPS